MRKLSLSDFRAVRQILTGDDFAVSEGPDCDELRSAMVDPAVWHSIQELPDTVSIATSGLHGPELALENELHGEWITRIGYDEHDNLMSDVVKDVAFDIETEWSAATFSAVHGYYRQAIGTLRNALEACVVAARYQSDSENPFYQDWLKGLKTIKFSDACAQVADGAAKIVNSHLRGKGLRAFIDRPKRGSSWVYDLYERLCNPAHSRPGYTHAAYWSGSNGPIFEKASFLQFHDHFLETMAATWALCKLVRPSLSIPTALLTDAKTGRWGMEAKIVFNLLNHA